jgi:MFS family permease
MGATSAAALKNARTPGPNYKWVALANTTAGVFMSAVDGSIVLISLPAIFRGIQLNPLASGNIGFLLWMIMGYRLVQAVLVVPLGRLGDIFGRVRIYNGGFAVFTLASVLLSFDPYHGAAGAVWLIAWRILQAVGGSVLMANSAAILTDAFPSDQRGFALGINQIAGLAGQFIGLILGGVLVLWDWRAVFWVNLPVGIFGTLWAYLKLQEIGVTGATTAARDGGPRPRARDQIDWWGTFTFTIGLSAVLVALTEGIHPYGDHAMGWTNPMVIAEVVGGLALLVVFVLIEARSRKPMFQLGLFRIRAFTTGNLAGLAARLAQGGLQFMLIIWLQGIWLPLHGYEYSETPLWAGIFMLPLTFGFLITGPVAGRLSDRIGSRGLAGGGMLLFAASFVGLMLLPTDFPYWAFALLIGLNGVGVGAFSAPNTSSIMGSVPIEARGVASGMRSTFQNTGTSLSIGVFFSLMITGLASTLPHTMTAGLTAHGVPQATAERIGGLPPVSSLFAAILGVNPIGTLLGPGGVLERLPAAAQHVLTGREFFPSLISAPFHHGLTIVFAVSAALGLFGAVASLSRGRVAVAGRRGDRAAPPAQPASGQSGQSGEDRPGEDRPGEDRPGKDRAGKDRAGKDRPGKDRAGRDRD